MLSFQDYEELLETEGDEEHYINMPDWYEFYDGRVYRKVCETPDFMVNAK
ncbi:MAG: hypothetical protein IPF58_18745 [Saprospirales bacterium]|nr:hypothetical protein [Saprospirales bacterium]